MTTTDQVSTAEQPTGTVTSAEATLFQQPPFSQQSQPLPRGTSEPHPSASPQPSKAVCGPSNRGDTDRLANWLLGVEPQDVRFPVNIVQLAFTANYFAALTSDRRKIYVNRRTPGWRGNCKRRSIDFTVEQRPASIVSFDLRDTLCVVFRHRVEFYSLTTMAIVGAYDTLTAEVVAAGARCGRSPLGALWCTSTAAVAPKAESASAPSTSAAFTVWTDRTDAPQRALLLGPSVVGRPERFLCFYWTSTDTVLLVSRQSEPPTPTHSQLRQQPLIFCAYDTAGRRPMQRLCRRSVNSARQFCLSPDGRLLLLSGGSRHQLLEAATLRQLLVLPRRNASVAAPLPMAVTNCGDLVLLQAVESAAVGAASLEIHRRGGGLGQPTRFDLAGLLGYRCSGVGDCRIYAVGELGALLVFEQDGGSCGGGGGSCGGGVGGSTGTSEGDRPGLGAQQQPLMQPRSLFALVDLNGNVIMRAEWPRSHVHLVSDDLLVCLKRLSTKPFSAAHACVFDFNATVARRSLWAGSDDARSSAAASKPTAVDGGLVA